MVYVELDELDLVHEVFDFIDNNVHVICQFDTITDVYNKLHEPEVDTVSSKGKKSRYSILSKRTGGMTPKFLKKKESSDIMEDPLRKEEKLIPLLTSHGEVKAMMSSHMSP